MFYKDAEMTISDKVFTVICYALPIITLVFIPSLWFMYPLLALFLFIRRPRRYITRFQLVQSLLCFLIFVFLLAVAIVIGGANMHNPVLVTTVSLAISALLYLYFVLVLLTVLLVIIDRYLRIPLLRRVADRYGRRVLPVRVDVTDQN